MAKLTKTDHICKLLADHGPMTRDRLTRGAWVLEGGKVPYRVTSNHCYFVKSGKGNGGHMSLVARGLIQIVGRAGRKYLFDLTPAGRQIAAQYPV